MAVRSRRAQKTADTMLILLFVTAIGLPLAASLPKLVMQGHRLAWDSLSSVPGRVEGYVNEHFTFRRTLLRWHSLLKVGWLGMSSCTQVLVGTNGWLFYTPDPEPLPRPFQEHELVRWQRVLEARRDWLAVRGVPYLLVVAPDKQAIYPEMLPAALRQGPAASRLDQLLTRLRTHSAIAVLDLRESLLRAKTEERVYYRTDSHWNERGAFIAYEQIMAALAEWFPEARSLPRGAFQDVRHDMPGGDLASMLRLSDRLHEDWLGLCPQSARRAQRSPEVVAMNETFRLPHLKPMAMECPGCCGPRAVMFYDSFGEILVPFLSEHFARIVYVPQYEFDPAVVERERPHVVIQQLVQRKLNKRAPEDPEEVRELAPSAR